MAGAADGARMERLGAGQRAANDAQDLQRRRGQDYFENNLKMGDRLSGLSSDYSAGALSNDQALLDAFSPHVVSILQPLAPFLVFTPDQPMALMEIADLP